MSSEPVTAFALSCPLPLGDTDRILLGHGSGGRMTAELIARCFLPAFRNQYLEKLDDHALVSVGGVLRGSRRAAENPRVALLLWRPTRSLVRLPTRGR